MKMKICFAQSILFCIPAFLTQELIVHIFDVSLREMFFSVKLFILTWVYFTFGYTTQ